MSQKANQDESSQSLTPEEIKAKEAAAKAAEATGEQPNDKAPDEAANDQLGRTGETDAQKIAKAIDAVYKINPELTLEEVTAIVASAFKKQASPVAQVAKEAARLITQPANRDIRKKIYLKKDKDKKFPLDESALDGIIVRQTYKRKTEEGDEITVPARNLNELAIYTPDDFERMSEPGRGFEREGITAEVWHKPGQTGTVQESE